MLYSIIKIGGYNYMENLVELYDRCLEDAKIQNIESGIFNTKPTFTEGILSSDSRICVQPVFNFEFAIDKKGMHEVIKLFQDLYLKEPESNKKNLLAILSDLNIALENYLGGHGIQSKRSEAYMASKDGCLNLSDIKGKQIGLCAERGIVAHQLLALMEKVGIMKSYQPLATLSHLKTDERYPHFFITLKNKKDKSKNYLFDIENPVQFQTSKDAKPVTGIALYSLSEDEFKDLQNGKLIAPKTVYEQVGYKLADSEPKRYYGDAKEKEEIEL